MCAATPYNSWRDRAIATPRPPYREDEGAKAAAQVVTEQAVKAATRAHRLETWDAAREYIQEHCWPRSPRDKLVIAEVASAVGTSPRHLQRIIRLEGGTTFTEVVQATSMQRAEQVLLDGLMPVSDIARLAGYRHAGRFAAVFKRHRRVHPDRLRRRRLGRRARRIGGVRGSARFEGRLSPAAIRAREQTFARRVERLRGLLSARQAESENENYSFGFSWPAIYASIITRECDELRRGVELLGRRAWREQTDDGKQRREALLVVIADLRRDAQAVERRAGRA